MLGVVGAIEKDDAADFTPARLTAMVGLAVAPSAEDTGAAGAEVLLPPPHPAKIAVISIVICHTSGLVTLSILFIFVSPKKIPK
jgi:hypothetical protein